MCVCGGGGVLCVSEAHQRAIQIYGWMTIKRKGFRQGVEGAGIILFPDIFRAALVPSGLLVYVSLTSVTSNRKGPHGKSYLCTS